MTYLNNYKNPNVDWESCRNMKVHRKSLYLINKCRKSRQVMIMRTNSLIGSEFRMIAISKRRNNWLKRKRKARKWKTIRRLISLWRTCLKAKSSKRRRKRNSRRLTFRQTSWIFSKCNILRSPINLQSSLPQCKVIRMITMMKVCPTARP